MENVQLESVLEDADERKALELEVELKVLLATDMPEADSIYSAYPVIEDPYELVIVLLELPVSREMPMLELEVPFDLVIVMLELSSK